MTEPVGNNIQILGVKQTVAALKAFEPELLAKMNRQIRSSMGNVQRAAQSKYPQGSYVVNVNAKKILGSVAARAGGGAWLSGGKWRKLSELSPGTRASIFEFAGKRSPGATPQAQGLIAMLNRRYGSPGRFLWAAWDEVGQGVLTEIEASVKEAERELQTRLEAAGEGF